MLGLVGHREVTHDEPEAKLVYQIGVLRQRLQFIVGQPHSRHARVDLKIRAGAVFNRAGSICPS